MNTSWWLGNLVAYSAQVAVVVLAGGLAGAALRLKQPRVTLAYWQAVLMACLLLPLLEPWQRMDTGAAGSSVTVIGTGVRSADMLLGLFPLHAWVLPVLVAGVGLGLLRLALGLWRLNHFRRAALRIAPPFPGVLREAQALVSVASAFYLSDRVGSPVTFGWLCPAVIFPRRFECMDETQQRAIACHELLHVARHDWLANLFEELILTFFWFHPAVWWVMRSIRLSREQVVDCEVVALTGARQPYLHALLEIAGVPRAMPVPAPLFLAESQLARRVALLVKEVRMSKPRLVASLAIALAVLVAAGWWAVRTFWLIAPPTSMFYKVGGDVTAPVPIYKPDPPYTSQARKDKVQGTVVTEVMVDASGNVAGVKLTSTSVPKSPGEGLEESAIETLRTWKFKPSMKKGKPVPARVMVEVSFKMF